MPLTLSWTDVAVRLLLTAIAGAVIGFNRGARGHAAGLRTTTLVGLAAAVAMIQANMLLSVSGKTPASFGVMDLMRLPLGILTGVGFIGGGAILKRGELVTGVTTAATLWMMTVVGLCLGGGQIGLGIAATTLAVGTLWGMKWVDVRLPREHRAAVVIKTTRDSAAAGEFPNLVRPLGFTARFQRQTDEDGSPNITVGYEVSWRRAEAEGPPLDLLRLVNERFFVASFELTSETRD